MFMSVSALSHHSTALLNSLFIETKKQNKDKKKQNQHQLDVNMTSNSIIYHKNKCMIWWLNDFCPYGIYREVKAK